ncbi:hypothetical protein BGX38DRAFT_1146405 [Terfezia claveryi]|nr:hypothetical protein BGX38DRAFT_1146405 [Terfezia claveryi]
MGKGKMMVAVVYTALSPARNVHLGSEVRTSARSDPNNQSSYRQTDGTTRKPPPPATGYRNTHSNLGVTTIATLSPSIEAFSPLPCSCFSSLSQKSPPHGHWSTISQATCLARGGLQTSYNPGKDNRVHPPHKTWLPVPVIGHPQPPPPLYCAICEKFGHRSNVECKIAAELPAKKKSVCGYCGNRGHGDYEYYTSINDLKRQPPPNTATPLVHPDRARQISQATCNDDVGDTAGNESEVSKTEEDTIGTSEGEGFGDVDETLHDKAAEGRARWWSKLTQEHSDHIRTTTTIATATTAGLTLQQSNHTSGPDQDSMNTDDPPARSYAAAATGSTKRPAQRLPPKDKGKGKAEEVPQPPPNHKGKSRERTQPPLARSVVLHTAPTRYKPGQMRGWIEEDNKGAQILGIRWLL